MATRFIIPATITLLLIALFATVALTRPLLPVDETRYLTVAWDFYQRDAWLLPTLNFEPYHHKPPMLFWLINLAWQLDPTISLWGVRIVTLLTILGVFALTAAIARTLWPAQQGTRDLVLLMMLSTPFLLIYGTLIMFDALLSVAVLVGMLALLKIVTTGARGWWLVLGIALGLGALIKGPVVVLHIVPILFLVRWWRPDGVSFSVSEWAQGIIFAVMIGLVIGLSWALPAAEAGGPAYADMIFRGQSAERMVNSFDHARSPLFFLMLLPVVFLPWVFIPSLWRAILRQRCSPRRASWQVRFLLCWMIPVFAAFMAISGKQIHYLIPLLPAALLLLAHGIQTSGVFERLTPRRLLTQAVMPVFILVLVLLAGEEIVRIVPSEKLGNAAIQFQHADPRPLMFMAALILLAVILWRVRPALFDLRRTLIAIGTLTVLALMALHVSLAPLLKKYYDLTTVGEIIRHATALGAPIAVVRAWHGEVGYYARMSRPVTILADDNAVQDWLRQNRNGIVIYRHNVNSPPANVNTIYTQPYRSPTKAMSIVTRRTRR